MKARSFISSAFGAIVVAISCPSLASAGPSQAEPLSQVELAAIPQWQRRLNDEDAARVNDLERRIWELRRQARYADAIPLAEEMAAIRTRALGADHWQADRANRLVETLKFIARLPAEAQAELAEAERAYGQQQLLFGQCRHVEALAIARRRLEVLRRWLGDNHPDVRVTLKYAGFMVWEGEGDLAGAEALFREALAMSRELYPEGDLRVDADIHNLAVIRDVRGDYAEAEELFRESLAIRLKHGSPTDRHLATKYSRLGWVLVKRGHYTAAEPLLREALAIARSQTLGDWWDQRREVVLRALGRLALLLEAKGNYPGAESLIRESLAMRRKLLEEGRGTIQSLYDSARSLRDQGDDAAAEVQHNSAAVRQRRLLEQEADVGQALNDLARLLHVQGRCDEAKPRYEEALALRRTLGGADANVPESLNNLARLLHDQSRYDEAETLYEEALTILRDAHDEEHPDIAQNLNDLARLLHDQGRYDQAKPLYEEALAMRRKLLGNAHPDVAATLSNLARLLHDMGDDDAAEEKWQDASESFEAARLNVSTVGLERAQFAADRSPLAPLAACLASRGKAPDAWQALEANLARGLLDALSARNVPLSAEDRGWNEDLDQQLATLRGQIGVLLRKRTSDDTRAVLEELYRKRDKLQAESARFKQKLAREYGVPAGKVYELGDIQKQLSPDAALLAWVDVKPTLHAADPDGEHWACVVRHEGEPIWVELRGSGEGNAWTDHDNTLPRRVREALSAARSATCDAQPAIDALYRQRLAPVERHLSDVRRVIVLPAGWMAGVPIEALTDEYGISYAPSGTMYAWLRQKGRGDKDDHLETRATLLALGDPVFERRKALSTPSPAPPDHGVLLAMVTPGSGTARSGLRPGDVLLTYDGRKLAGPDDLTAVIEGPAAANTTRGGAAVPVEVWRGGQTLKLAVASGNLDVELCPQMPAAALSAEYHLDAALTATRGEAFTPLPGTGREVEVIARLFGRIRAEAKRTVLLKSDASEQKLEQLAASGELSQFRFVHLATHGMMDDQVAMRSALILSQDRLGDPLKRALAGQEVYDGRLTAAQIIRSWKLDADLVTLSACQTALGKAAGGEGHLGFSQALFLAGARSLLASLWKVDDTATALLMIRFYENLLDGRDESSAEIDARRSPMSKAEALREAKAWLRGLTAEQVRRLCTTHHLPLPSTLARGEPGPMRTAETLDHPFEHPYYWASFILLGSPD